MNGIENFQFVEMVRRTSYHVRRHHRDKWLFRVESEKSVHVKMSVRAHTHHQNSLALMLSNHWKNNFTEMKNIVRFMWIEIETDEAAKKETTKLMPT